MPRYFVIRVPLDDDGPDASVVIDSESDVDLLPQLRDDIVPVLDTKSPHTRYVIAREV
jgi:hypothetical protein